MKNIPFLFLTTISTFILLAGSCNKASEFDPNEVLSQHSWKLHSTAVNGEVRIVGEWQDEVYIFKADHSFYYDSEFDYVQEAWGEWEINQSNLLLKTHFNQDDPSQFYETEYIIYQLTNSTLILGTRYEANGQMNSFKSIYNAN